MQETFEAENFRELHSFVAICESFTREIWNAASFGVSFGMSFGAASAKVFSAKSTNSSKFSVLKVSRYAVYSHFPEPPLYNLLLPSVDCTSLL